MTENQLTPEPAEISDAIGELARARRERVLPALPQTLPPWLEQTEKGEALYTFRPVALPYRLMDPHAFVEALRDAFGLVLGKLDLAPLLATISREELVRLNERDLLGHLTRSIGGRLTFTTGRFAQRDEFYAIPFVWVNFERIHVQVTGPTVVAETVARDIAEMMWAAVGVTKQWPAIEPRLINVKLGTATRITLPAGADSLLNPRLWKFLQDNLNDETKFARDFGAIPAPGRGEQSKVVAVPNVDNIIISIGVLDLISGYQEDASLTFDVTARSDHGRGRVLVSSDLGYERHMELLGHLIDSLGAPE